MTVDDGTEYVALDLETTGLSARVDRVVEVGAVRFARDGTELARFERLVNPERPMSPAAQAIHGISDADLADAPTAREVLPEFFAFLGPAGASVLLAHNSWFDAQFLGMERGRAGLDDPGYGIVDTLALARRHRPNLPNHRLETLARVFRLDPGGSHRALADSRRVKDLWLALGGPDEPPGGLVAYPLFDQAREINAPVGWEPLARAIADGRKVRMAYSGGTRGGGPREVTPRGFVQRGGVAFMVAFCHLDAFEKTFRLDRLQWYEVLDGVAHEAGTNSLT
jgi:DNA polymerase III epsilon subunit family exonuclease